MEGWARLQAHVAVPRLEAHRAEDRAGGGCAGCSLPQRRLREAAPSYCSAVSWEKAPALGRGMPGAAGAQDGASHAAVQGAVHAIRYQAASRRPSVRGARARRVVEAVRMQVGIRWVAEVVGGALRRERERKTMPWAWIEGGSWILSPEGTSQPPCPAQSAWRRGGLGEGCRWRRAAGGSTLARTRQQTHPRPSKGRHGGCRAYAWAVRCAALLGWRPAGPGRPGAPPLCSPCAGEDQSATPRHNRGWVGAAA